MDKLIRFVWAFGFGSKIAVEVVATVEDVKNPSKRLLQVNVVVRPKTEGATSETQSHSAPRN
jgi:hypothetical protein